MHNLLESWLPGLKVPNRNDYLAGGKFARQSYYDSMLNVAVSILDLAETYTGLKLRIQRVRHARESDPLPLPKELLFGSTDVNSFQDQPVSKLLPAVKDAKAKIFVADELG